MNDWSKADAAIKEAMAATEEFRRACRENRELCAKVLALLGRPIEERQASEERVEG